MADKSMDRIMKGVDTAAKKRGLAPPLREEETMAHNQQEARKAAGYHGDNQRTKDMTKATVRLLESKKLDAEYDALVGGKKGRAVSKARNDRMDAENRRRLEGK